MTITWTTEAEELVNKAPLFIRPMAKKKLEKIAREKGIDTIDADLVRAVRDESMEKTH